MIGLLKRTLAMGATLAIPAITMFALVSGSAVIAQQDPPTTQQCQAQFDADRAACNSLTGTARAFCQRQAADRFRRCRGQVSPTSLMAPQSATLASTLRAEKLGN